ncbi:MAG: hypothetical protein RH949_15985 [Coleofasciculus sp. A1-SPW-01]
MSQTLEPLWLLVPQRVLVYSRSRCCAKTQKLCGDLLLDECLWNERSRI